MQALLDAAHRLNPDLGAEPRHSSSSSQLLVLSARTADALAAMRTHLALLLRQQPELTLTALARLLQTGMSNFAHRCAMVCRDRADALRQLDGKPAHVGCSNRQAPLVFMFPGQGAQYPEMGRGLYESEPIFRAELDACAELLLPMMGSDLRDLLYCSRDPLEAAQRIGATSVAQPAIFAIEYSLARLWMRWGIRPQAMIGHSVGEYVAAVLAGVFSLKDALSLVSARGQLMQELPGGAMLIVHLAEQELLPMLDATLAIAAINGPALCVVSGPRPAISALKATLAARGVVNRRLPTPHAFHSAMVNAVIEPLRERLQALPLSVPRIPYVSCVTGNWIRTADATSPNYWAGHARRPVRFADGIATVLAHGLPILLEVGPGNTLSTLVSQTVGARAPVVSSLPPAAAASDDRDGLLHALAQLWIHGVSPDWSVLQGGKRSHLRLPQAAVQPSMVS